MLDVTVIEDPAAAAASLDPVRARLLAELAAGPASAAMLAARVDLPRQKVNYHLKALERHGLVELAGERRKGNVTERVMRATASSYVISPSALAAVQPDPARFRDELSARWLLALAARLVRDVGALITGAARARQRVATFALDAEVQFASAGERAAFVQELTAGVSALVAKYHAPEVEGGRSHRVVVALHPTVKPQTLAELTGPAHQDAGSNDVNDVNELNGATRANGATEASGVTDVSEAGAVATGSHRVPADAAARDAGAATVVGTAPADPMAPVDPVEYGGVLDVTWVPQALDVPDHPGGPSGHEAS
jgi:DNA-binding transcriptional ArsR family regulator